MRNHLKSLRFVQGASDDETDTAHKQNYRIYLPFVGLNIKQSDCDADQVVSEESLADTQDLPRDVIGDQRVLDKPVLGKRSEPFGMTQPDEDQMDCEEKLAVNAERQHRNTEKFVRKPRLLIQLSEDRNYLSVFG
jgi:hypothetical protein